MRPTFVIAITALLIAAPASAAHKPKHPRHQKHKVTHSGKLVKRTASSVTVKDGDHTVTCSRTDASPGLGDAKVGKDVTIKCEDGVLTAIAKTDPPPPAVDTQTAVGALAARSDASVTVHGEKGDVTCTRGSGSPALGDVRPGDRVKITCANGVLTAIAKLDPAPPPAPPAPVDVTVTRLATLTAVTDGSLTVHNGDGDLTCTRTDRSPALGDAHVGDPVKVACTNGVLTAFAKVTTAGTVTMMTTGAIVELTPTSLTVLSDGGNKTCARNEASPSLDGYAVGNHVKATCVNGALSAIAHL